MKPKQLAGFAAVVALVAGYAIFDYRQEQKSIKQKDEQSYLLQASVDQVSQIAVDISGERIELQRSPDGWKLLKPVQDLANNNRVEKFLEGIETEKMTELVTEGAQVDFARFGLDQPKGTITLTVNSGEKTIFAIGSRKNFQGDAYLRKNEENKVLIGSATWFPKLESNSLDFRDKRLMRQSNASTDQLTFIKASEKFKLEKKEDQWRLVGQPAWKLDQNKVREVIAQLNSTEAVEFIAENNVTPKEMARWGLNLPALQLIVEGGAGDGAKIWQAKFAAGPDKVYRVQVSNPNVVFKIMPTDYHKFYQITADSFRDRGEAFQFDRLQVRSLHIQLGASSFDLQSTDEKAGQLISMLAKMPMSGFKFSVGAALDNEIIFKNEKGEEIYRLQWGQLHAEKTEKGDLKAFAAKSSTYPQGFSILESDILALNLKDLKSEGKNK